MNRHLAAVPFALRRFGWGSAALLALCAAGALTLTASQRYLRTQLQTVMVARANAEQALRAAPPAPAPARNDARLAQFYDALGESRYAEQQVKTLFAVAAKNGLTLSQAEYKLTKNAAGRFSAYQITLPVRGSYTAIRRFAEQTLLAIPFASLDQMQFRRDAIGNNVLESRLRLTVYLADKAPVAKVRE